MKRQLLSLSPLVMAITGLNTGCAAPTSDTTSEATTTATQAIVDRTFGYEFVIDNIYVVETRAHTDSDMVAIVSRIDGPYGTTMIQGQSVSIGEIEEHSGSHPEWISSKRMNVPGDATAHFSFLVTNLYDTTANDGLKWMSDETALLFDRPSDYWKTLNYLSFARNGEWWAGQCDGNVAGDVITMSADDLKAKTDATGTYWDAKYYAGNYSSLGCGPNSGYSVYYHVTRTPLVSDIDR